VQQESIPWQSFVFDAVGSLTIRNTSLGPWSTTGIPVCVLQGLGDGDFSFLKTPWYSRIVPKQKPRGAAEIGFVWNNR
jgi:hypothetical protein